MPTDDYGNYEGDIGPINARLKADYEAKHGTGVTTGDLTSPSEQSQSSPRPIDDARNARLKAEFEASRGTAPAVTEQQEQEQQDDQETPDAPRDVNADRQMFSRVVGAELGTPAGNAAAAKFTAWYDDAAANVPDFHETVAAYEKRYGTEAVFRAAWTLAQADAQQKSRR
jgi:hypothetical protein